MPYNRNMARLLLSESELRLFDESRRHEVATLTRAELRSRRQRALRMRDRYAQLAQQAPALGQDSRLRMQEKHAIFDEVLARFERQIGRTDAAAQRARDARDTQLRLKARKRELPDSRGKAAGTLSPAASLGQASPRAAHAASVLLAHQTGRLNIHPRLNRPAGPRKKPGRKRTP
jgi:hypothetical protein